MYKEYDPKDLDMLRKAELLILRDFSEVCEKHGIKWFAFAGAAIGAVRHKGFIPWDDDLDLGILREDYNKFLKIWEKELGDKYHLATPETDKYYSSPVVKLMRKGTKFVPEYAVKSKAELGIHIDIFVYDNYTNDERSSKQTRKARFWDQLFFLKTSGNPDIPLTGAMGLMAKIACVCIHGALKLFCISPNWMYQRFNKVAQMYNSVETEYVTLFQDPRIHDSRISRSELFPLKKLKFEDITIPVQNEYMTLLERYYGSDVMQLPPEEKRVNHAPAVIEFGPYTLELGRKNL